MLVDMGLPLEVVAAVIGHEAGGKETRLWSAITFGPIKLNAKFRYCAPGTSGCRLLWLVASKAKSFVF